MLRYYRHYFMAKGMLADAVKAEFLEHAQQEQAHAGKLAERIVQLGGEPDFNPDTLTARSHAEYKEGSDLRDMVRENLVAERIAIDSYREMINFIGDRDTTTKRILKRSWRRRKNTPTSSPTCWKGGSGNNGAALPVEPSPCPAAQWRGRPRPGPAPTGGR